MHRLVRLVCSIWIGLCIAFIASFPSYAIPPTVERWGGACPYADLSDVAWAAMVARMETSGGGGNTHCFQSELKFRAQGGWNSVLALLKSSDMVARSEGLRALSGRDSVKSAPDEIITLLISWLRDSAMGKSRLGIQEALLRFRDRALPALPDFFLEASRPGLRLYDPFVANFLKLSNFSETRSVYYLALLNSRDASIASKAVVAARVAAYGEEAREPAIPVVRQLIEEYRDEPTEALEVLVSSYLALDRPEMSLPFLMEIRTSALTPRFGIAIDNSRFSPEMGQQLIALLDTPVYAAAAVTLGAMARVYPGEADKYLKGVAEKLMVLLSDLGTRERAIEIILALKQPVQGAAPILIDVYQSATSTIAKRRALRAVGIVGGLSVGQVEFLATEAAKEVRRGYDPTLESENQSSALRLLADRTSLPANIVPMIVRSFVRVGGPLQQGGPTDMAELKPEAKMLIAILGKTNSPAGARALVDIYTSLSRGSGRIRTKVDVLDQVAQSILEIGDPAIQVLERKLRRSPAIDTVYFEVILSKLKAATASLVFAEHRAQVESRIWRFLVEPTGTTKWLDYPDGMRGNALYSRFGHIPLTQVGLALFRARQLNLQPNAEILRRVVQVLYSRDADTVRCADEYLKTVTDKALLKNVLKEALGRAPNAFAERRLREADPVPIVDVQPRGL